MTKEIIVYSQAGCQPCKKVKEFLQITGREFIVKEVDNDPQALAELKAMNYMSTPITMIDGQAVVGFNIGQLNDLLEDE